MIYTKTVWSLTALCLELSADAFGRSSALRILCKQTALLQQVDATDFPAQARDSSQCISLESLWKICSDDLVSQVGTVQSANRHSKQTEQVCSLILAVQILKMQPSCTQCCPVC